MPTDTAWRGLLVASLFANAIGAVGVALLAGRSGVPPPAPAPASTYYEQASASASRFDGLPVLPGDVVFVGDSHVDYGLWTEFFGSERVRSRGQEGEGVFGVQRWIRPILDGRPALIFLWAGGNDLYNGVPLERVEAGVHALIAEARERAPGTEVVLLSALPMTKSHVLHGVENVRAAALNAVLARVSHSEGVRFVDLRPRLAARDGTLDLRLSFDGSHLNGAGYARVIETLLPLVSGALTAQDHPRQPAPP